MNAPIWAPKGMGNRGACCKIPYKGYEISIAMDDSCGAFEQYSRSDIRVYRDSDDQDVTDKFLADGQYTLCGDADTLKAVFQRIDELHNFDENEKKFPSTPAYPEYYKHNQGA